MKALILAGGLGTRLRPYTSVIPKPLMPVGQKPILEWLLNKMVNNGFEDIFISVGYLAGLIEAYCGDGSKYGAKITYLREDRPLGTAGPIHLMNDIEEPFIITNGDILTDLNYRDLYEYHLSGEQELTVATFNKKTQIPLGVLSISEESFIYDYDEKPTLGHDVSMGVYCCSKEILNHVPKNTRYDLPDLVKGLILKELKVGSFLHEGKWLDIGNHDDYELAQKEIENF